MANVLASFPNSRIKPRSATSVADTKRARVNGDGEATGTVLEDGGVVTANGNTQVIAPNQNQTYINLRNESNERLYYSYTDDPAIINNGSFLEAGEAFDMESKQGVWCRSSTGSRLWARLDFGEG